MHNDKACLLTQTCQLSLDTTPSLRLHLSKLSEGPVSHTCNWHVVTLCLSLVSKQCHVVTEYPSFSDLDKSSLE